MKKNIVSAKTWIKYFKLDKEHFEAFEKYTTGKLKYSWFKKLMMGIFGGLFVGFGYTAYLFVAGQGHGDTQFWFSLVGALLFPVALLLCIYFGGSLFTSSCMGVISLLYKQHKVRHYVIDLTLVLIGNGLGGLIFALIVWGSNLFGGMGESELTNAGVHILEIVRTKIDGDHQWWNNILSGIICNFIVVGTTILSLVTKRNGISVFIIYLMLIIFVLLGVQHVVANLYLFTIGGFMSISSPANAFNSVEVGQLFYQNLIPALVGNVLGGVGLTLLYLSVQSYVSNKKSAKTPSDTTPKIEIKDK